MSFLYEKIYDSLKQEILTGKYKVGDQIPTEKELAKSYGVSTITTKKALEKLTSDGLVYRKRGKGTFVLETNNQKQITENKVNSKKPLFGLVLTGFSESFGNHLIESLEEASHDKCLIALRISKSIPEKEDQLIRELIDWGIDGLIVSPAVAEHYSIEILKMVVNKFPLVLIDRSFKGLATASVSTNNEQAAKMGMHHLFDLGHSDIGVLLPTGNSTTTIEDRKKGIVEAFTEKKMVVNRKYWCGELDSSLASYDKSLQVIETIKNHLNENPEITALLALEYNLALLAKQAIEQMGRKVPEDISIICFDSPRTKTSDWSFTHLEQNEEEIAHLALNTLLDMHNGDFEIGNIRVPARLVQGDTTVKNSR